MQMTTMIESRRRGPWAVVLAGGEGVRLRALVSRIYGDDRPKQYAALLDSRTLLRQTLDRVSLAADSGVLGLLGPNGSGKTTLMNLMTGLIRPSRGRIEVLGITPDEPEELFRRLGYCAQFDSFPAGMSGYRFVYST